MASPASPKIRVEFRHRGKKVDAAVVIQNSNIRRHKNGRVLMLVDQVVTLPVNAHWHDKPRKVRMVLKLYCKLSTAELRSVKKQRALLALEEGSPILT